MSTYGELPRFVLTRGLALCALLLGATLLLLLRAGEGGPLALRLYEYAQAFEFTALVAFGCATVGSLLVEDLLRYYGA